MQEKFYSVILNWARCFFYGNILGSHQRRTDIMAAVVRCLKLSVIKAWVTCFCCPKKLHFAITRRVFNGFSSFNDQFKQLKSAI